MKVMKSISIYGNCPICDEKPALFDKPIYSGIEDITGEPRKLYQIGCVFCDLFTNPSLSRQICIVDWRRMRDKKLALLKMKL